MENCLTKYSSPIVFHMIDFLIEYDALYDFYIDEIG